MNGHIGFPGDDVTLCGAVQVGFGTSLRGARCVRCVVAYGELVARNPLSVAVRMFEPGDLRSVWLVRDAAMAGLLETSDPARLKLLWRIFLVAAIVNRRHVPHVSSSEAIAFVNLED